MVFAIVVTERLVGERISQTSRRLGGGAVVAVLLIGIVVDVIRRTPLAMARPGLSGDLTALLGTTVLTDFALAFELLAVLLLTSLVGAIYFARPED